MGFVGLRWTPGEREQARAARIMADKLGDHWTRLMDRRGLLLLHDGAGLVEHLADETGFVFGERFGAALDPSPLCETQMDPAPGWIAERWGPYAAVLIDRGFDVVRVLRDPSGAQACFLSLIAGVQIFFSEARDFVTLAPDARPDLGFVRAFLGYPLHLGRRTGLAGVEELWPGECAVYPRVGRRLELYWSPQRFARNQPAHDWATGVPALRAAAEHCVRARARRHRRIALRLSGGFDSSVMLGLLKSCTDAEIVCINEYWEGAPEGDERRHARSVAAGNGADLVELRMDPAEVRYERALCAPLTVKPTLSVLSYGNSDIGAFYADLACDLITSGQGGDHLFHRSRTAWIAADAVRDGVGLAPAMRIGLDTARLTGRSVWEVFAVMARSGLFGAQARFHNRSSVMGVLEPGAEEAPADHGWLADLRHSPPARTLRIHQLLDALNYHDASVLSEAAPTAPLLLSQPIIETCLMTPPYIMTRGGKERALARAAFSDLVAPAVLQRSRKGETTRYFAAILAENGAWIRSILSNGQLVQSGLANARAMEAALQRDWRQDALAADGLYALIAAECWLRTLAAECARAEAA